MNSFARAESARAAASASANTARQLANAASLLSDSAEADSVALANVPPGRRDDFSFAPLLVGESRDSMAWFCHELSGSSSAEVRKRLRGEWPPGWITVLFVRADRESGSLNRVELMRRVREVEGPSAQRGYIFDHDADETKAVEWANDRVAPETYVLPEGTPTPRALRGLGRRLLVLPCRGTAPGGN